MNFLNKIKQLLRFAARRPVAQIFRAECLDQAMAIQVKDLPTFPSKPTTKAEFLAVAEELQAHAHALTDAERNLRQIEAASFASSDSRMFGSLSKLAALRRTSLDDIAFFKRATLLGFSEGNLGLAFNQAVESQSVWQDEFNRSKATLESRLRSLTNGGALKLLFLG